MRVLVTGGAGYIGSHVVWMLLDHEHEPVVVDDLSTGYRHLIPEDVTFFQADIGNKQKLFELFAAVKPEAVMHFAGSIVVPESVSNPLKYYEHNTINTINLVEACIRHNVKNFVFSSTAAVYGDPEKPSIDEKTPTQPTNPYGMSKLMVERILRDVSNAHDFRHINLRYFNVAGADPMGRTGQSTPQATHLIKVATQTLLGIRPSMKVFGTDYDTRDGTCVRDFIHVSDLAEAHILALNHLTKTKQNNTFNCGYGHGFSVLEILDAIQKAAPERPFTIENAERRPGDPPALVANSSHIKSTLKWVPKFDNITFIVKTALDWEKRLLTEQS
ncbi:MULTISPECIES: UDP-glucose 4-epimerase GalE [Thalassospira]|jgi:UDP-glucose 4-epimerase|uniref:UDP-glucose 4-epimerase GalE n=1 Tax=Thalassospira TaxID=168934 RepID=UPI0007A5AF18|nr:MULTISPECIES: UDP-glucose 4-epimerase GalE [unclassified Thalassospira]KZC99054.1 UDP-glucose 4-epimerase [Thalassospira sp. MCCC 1A02898]ONH88649.1 UDP-glucose 4-epimerase [Thalassospira sp. MCCC 1A02803]BDW90356.1 UDP-glucose 4-epimerase GalE [Thalassospira tepidiphila]